MLLGDTLSTQDGPLTQVRPSPCVPPPPPRPPRCLRCLKSVHGGTLMSGEAGCHGYTDDTAGCVGELPGWRLSFVQSRQTGHALFNDYPSICPLSLIPPCVCECVRAGRKHERKKKTRSQAAQRTPPTPSNRAARSRLSSSNFISI